MGGDEKNSTSSDFFDNFEFDIPNLFSIFESLDGVSEFLPLTCLDETLLVPQKSNSSNSKRKRVVSGMASSKEANGDHEQERMSHIKMERSRRKQMNEHLSMLKSLMPCFYVKRGDQASIIGGVVDYINELQQVLHSLEAKKQRKIYNNIEVLSPRPSSQLLIISPRKPPLSPRLTLPMSPRTPQPNSPYKPMFKTMAPTPLEPSNCSTSSSSSNSSIINEKVNELFANSRSEVADVEVKFSGTNIVLKTISHRIHGQALKIISALNDMSLEILHASVSTIDETMLISFTIKIGIECQLSADELAQQIQHTFC